MLCIHFLYNYRVQLVGTEFGVVAGSQTWIEDYEIGRQTRKGIGFPYPGHDTLSLSDDIALVKVDCPFKFDGKYFIYCN
jgi:hypothetical protein